MLHPSFLVPEPACASTFFRPDSPVLSLYPEESTDSLNSESHEHGKTGQEAKYVKGHDYDTKAAKGYHVHHEYYYNYDSKATKGSSGYYHEHASGHDDDDDEHDEGVSPSASPSISSAPSLSMRPSHNSYYHYYSKTKKQK